MNILKHFKQNRFNKYLGIFAKRFKLYNKLSNYPNFRNFRLQFDRIFLVQNKLKKFTIIGKISDININSLSIVVYNYTYKNLHFKYNIKNSSVFNLNFKLYDNYKNIG